MAQTFIHGERANQEFAPTTHWKAAAWAGVIAGVVFMMAEMLMVMVFQGESPWAPPRMMAAMVLGQGVLPPPADFDLKIMMAAMMIHFPLAVVYGFLLGWIVHRVGTGVALLIGLAFGLAIYLINFYPIAAAMFPWFAMARGWIGAASHMLFGLVAAAAYVGLRKSSGIAAAHSSA